MTTTAEETARAWCAVDPDPTTRAETERRLAASDEAWIREGFSGRLSFGTAGMRGPIGPGPNRMNRLTVRRVTRALALHVLEQGGTSAVVGYDGRHGSRVFAADAAAVLVGAGLRVHLFREVCPTPVLAYAVRSLGASAGVMVTASHNPPQDNGYKVYGPDGAQIVSPTDTSVSAHLDALALDAELPMAAGAVPVPDALVDDYVRDVLALRVHPNPVRRPIIAYTPMHGVGGALVQRVLGAAGYEVHTVPEQAEPDGDFPTVKFPNPEEKGALDLVLALARRVGAELVLANDPDADRIAVAVPDGGRWRPLTGNEVGTLLAEDLLAHGATAGPRLVATSLVSSSLLAKIAAAHGAAYAETLTGFKWIARAAITRPDARFVLGFEEALGVCVGEVVRDKDGVSAALIAADLAADRIDRGGLPGAIDELHRTHGVHLATQVSWTLPGSEGRAKITGAMRRFREEPPTTLGGLPVVASADTSVGTRRDLRTGEVSRLDLPASDVLVFEIEGGDRVLLRPSGTEPKLKAYVEVVEPVVGGDLASARTAAADRLERLRAELSSALD
ncbi:MAG: phospho-sugar mutase [Alphaproteobacteria bacterium]|nr:phospho-sugar mutase [Alphaproteobacteria bacterium]